MNSQSVEGLQQFALVSVVIPCHRCASTIGRAVESVASQSLRPAELILVEDGSGDDTLAVLYDLQEKYGDWVKVVSLAENGGVSSARNRGWELAEQPYIAFLDSDDAWHPKKVETQYDFMIKNPEVAMTGHAHRRLAQPDQKPNWGIEGTTAKRISKAAILLSNRFITPSVILKRDIPFRFSEGKRHMEDHLLWAQIISAGLPVFKLSVELAAIYKFAYGVGGLSSQSCQMQQGEADNYRQLSHEGFISHAVMKILVCLSLAKAFKRALVVATRRLASPTVRHVANYMSLTYSITGLLVFLGLAGKHVMAADVAIVQGAVLATFYVLSGDARHLILAEKMQAIHVAFFRLMWVIPLAVLAYFMSMMGGAAPILASALILRRAAEWLVEVHVTEIERLGRHWSGLPLQIGFLLTLSIEVIYFDHFWLVWPWALSPLVFSLRFLAQAKFNHFLFPGKAHVASTAIMGLSNYAFRIIVVGLVGKTFSGMLFPAIAIGSFTGTMFANVAGPTAIRKNLLDSSLFRSLLSIWALLGVAVFASAATLFIQTLGLSMVGGSLMIYAQKARLLRLKDSHTLDSDLLVHLILVCLTPIIYAAGGVQALAAIYLINAILAWIFYNGSTTYMTFNSINRNRTIFFLVLLLITPIFFQLQGNLYQMAGPLGIVDSGGKISLVPLPFSLLACYLGVALFSEGFRYSKPVILTIASMFFLLILSSLITGSEARKLILLVQFMLPITALLFGLTLGNLNRLLVAKAFLYFLMVFIPFHLVCTWTQGNLALTHYLYAFSVYQHYQYVPLILASLFAWAWVELGDSHAIWFYLLAPWMGMYVAAGNSILALFGLLAFACAFVIKNRARKSMVILLILSLSVTGYFYVNSIVASKLPSNYAHGVFIGKLFKKDGKELYADSSRTELPVNITSRFDIASIYIKGITENTETVLFGHAAPPPRSTTTSGHNYYLDLTYNFGLLACLPILALVVYTTSRFLKTRRNDPAALLLLFIVLYLVLIDSNFKVTLRQPYPGIVTFFLWGILISVLDPKRTSTSLSGN